MYYCIFLLSPTFTSFLIIVRINFTLAIYLCVLCFVCGKFYSTGILLYYMYVYAVVLWTVLCDCTTFLTWTYPYFVLVLLLSAGLQPDYEAISFIPKGTSREYNLVKKRSISRRNFFNCKQKILENNITKSSTMSVQ